MIILIDSREQQPLEFSHPYIEKTERCALGVGDYAAVMKDGHRPKIFFERKTIPDLVGTMTTGYKRFREEIKRSKANGDELILIIEGTVTDILEGTSFSMVEGLQILRTVLSIYERYQITHIFCRSRSEMATYIAEKFCAYERKRLKDKNAQKPRCPVR
jgi:ERCC4-type nuclease